MTIDLALVDTTKTAPPEPAWLSMFWHCDRAGNYSLYSQDAAGDYLRGVQVADANSSVSFTSIFPPARGSMTTSTSRSSTRWSEPSPARTPD